MSRFALATVVLSYLSVCRGAPAAPLASELARETDAEHRAERKAVTEGGRGGKSGGAAACSLQADCAIAQYCDDTHSCYECSVLNHTKVKCDALGGDCCSAAFLQNCPSNPKGCAPPPKCDVALASACGTARGSMVDCLVCGGVHASTVRGAGCSNDDIHQWCETGKSGGTKEFPGSRLLTAAWGRQLNTWAGMTGRQWSLCCSTFEGCDTAAKFHAACNAHAPTLTVAHNAGCPIEGSECDPWSQGSNPGNFTFGGFAAGSWSLHACCAVHGNDCGTDGPYAFCIDHASSSDWLFGLGPGPPQQFERTGADTYYRSVTDYWPEWGGDEDLGIGSLNSGAAPGGSYGACDQGGTYRGTLGEICGGRGNWGATDVEVWYPR